MTLIYVGNARRWRQCEKGNLSRTFIAVTYFFGLAKTSHLAKSLETKRVVLSVKSEKKAIWGSPLRIKKIRIGYILMSADVGRKKF